MSEWTPGAQLRYWRTRAGLLMQEVADKLRMSQQAISNWEADVAMPRVRILDLVDDIYGLEPGLTAAVTDKRNPPTPPAGMPEPLVDSLDADGNLVWTARVRVDEIAAASGIDLSSLTPGNRTKAREFIDFLANQQAGRKRK